MILGIYKTYEKMLSGMNNHGERVDQFFTSVWKYRRRNHRDIFETDTIKAFLNGALDVRQRVKFGVSTPRRKVRICMDSVEGRDQGIDTAGVACKFR
jgi:hypothetical protein